MLGDSPITSFDQVFVNSDRAIICNAFYPQVRDEVLRAHPWNCAKVMVQLAALSATPLYKFTYQYQLPVDPYCLKVLDVNDDDSVIWKVYGRTLLTDEGTVKITYIGRVNVELFDALLVSAISRRLAAQLAYPITSKANLFEAMWKAYEIVLQEARSVDSQEGTPPTFSADDLISVRG